MSKGFELSQQVCVWVTKGDVTQIRSIYGTVLVEYAYDAWGNVLDISGTYASTLGQNNPIRWTLFGRRL